MSERTERTSPAEVASPSDVVGAAWASSLAGTDGPPGSPATAPAQRARIKRRPTGAPPPLPHPITVNTRAWLLLAVIILTGAFLFSELTPWLRVGDGTSTWLLRRLADVRTPWLTDLARSVNAVGSGWAVTVVALSVVAPRGKSMATGASPAPSTCSPPSMTHRCPKASRPTPPPPSGVEHVIYRDI